MMSKKFKYIKLFIYGFVSFVLGIISITFYKTFSLDDNAHQFDSLVYNVSDGYIENVSVNTKVSLFFDYFDIKGYSVFVFDKDGNKLKDEDYVFSGSKTLVYNDEEVVFSYVNVIKGDIDSDGKVTDSDIELFSKYLISGYVLEDYQVKSFDINGDNSISSDDLALLNKAYIDGYEKFSLDKDNVTIRLGKGERLILNIEPNYVVDTNVKWVSSNEDVVSVDSVGRIFGKSGGEAFVQAIIGDGTNVVESRVIVDNSIGLESNSGYGYIEGYDTKVHIELEDYNGVSCISNDESISNCRVEGEYLIISAKKSGNTSIIVKKDRYKDAVYNVENITPAISSYYRAGCNMRFTPMVSFGVGELIFESSNLDVVKEVTTGVLNTGAKAYVFVYGDKAGRSTLKIRSVYSPKVLGEIIIDRSVMKLSDIGKVTTIGKEVFTSIIGENMGVLTCKSDNEDIATCKIEDNKLIVMPKSLGQANITVYNTINYNNGWVGECGNSLFAVVVQKSRDNTLKSLEINNGKINLNFDSSVLYYDAVVNSDSVEITAVVNDSNAVLGGDIGDKKLEYGINKFVITVTSEYGEVREYYLNITREREKQNKSNDFTLKSLVLSDGNIYFDKGKFFYKTSVGYDVEKIDVIAIPNNDRASVKIEKSDSLLVGKNNIVIVVTALDGTVGKYEIEIIREGKKEEIKKEETKKEEVKLSDDATIKSLVIKGYDLDFKSDIYDYDLLIGSENSLDIKVVLNSEKASYEIVDNENLVNGSIIKIKVKAEDGSSLEYKINIKKVKTKFNSGSIVDGVSLYILIGLVLLVMIVIVFNIIRDKSNDKKEEI